MRGLVMISLLVGAGFGVAKTLPLSWVTGDALEAADPDAAALGTVWSGHLAHIDGLPPIATTLEGRTVRLAADGPGLRLDGVAATDRISDVALALPIRSLSRFDGRLTGLAGTLNIDVESLEFGDAGCTAATGTARTDVLAVNAGTWNWSGPALSGPVTCEDGNVVVTMNGSDGSGTVDARVGISPAGPYRTTVTIRTQQPEAGLVLPLFGFEERGSAWTLSESGSWQ